MRNYDLYIDMQYSVPEKQLTIEDTNVKLELIGGLLSDWVRGCMGKGEDRSKANKKDLYNIRMTVDLTCDTFKIFSDTGNKGVTTGIIATSLGNWKLSPDLEERLKEAEKKNKDLNILKTN